MIYFEQPNYFYLTAIIPLIIIAWLLHWRMQAKNVMLLGDARLVAGLITTPLLRYRLLKILLTVLAVFILIAALAGPYFKINKIDRTATVPTDIVFVVDISKSMLVKDIAPNRLIQGIHLIKEICGRLTNQQAAIVLFAGRANIYVPLTDDHFYIIKAADGITNDLVLQQGTSLKDALTIPALLFKNKSKSNKLICFLTDGEFHKDLAFAVSDSLRAAGIQVFAFGLGTKTGGTIPQLDLNGKETIKKTSEGAPVTSHLNIQALLRLTGYSKGRYIQMHDKTVAATVFMNQLENIQQQNMGYSSEKTEFFGLFLFFVLILLIVEITIPN